MPCSKKTSMHKKHEKVEKKVVRKAKSHLKEDMKEAKVGIKRDKKLIKGLKKIK